MFVRVDEGARVFLDDGTIWRVGLNYVDLASGWRHGDPIEVFKDPTPRLTHPFRLFNGANGETIKVMESPSTSH